MNVLSFLHDHAILKFLIIFTCFHLGFWFYFVGLLALPDTGFFYICVLNFSIANFPESRKLWA